MVLYIPMIYKMILQPNSDCIPWIPLAGNFWAQHRLREWNCCRMTSGCVWPSKGYGPKMDSIHQLVEFWCWETGIKIPLNHPILVRGQSFGSYMEIPTPPAFSNAGSNHSDGHRLWWHDIYGCRKGVLKNAKKKVTMPQPISPQTPFKVLETWFLKFAIKIYG